jgi:hypothetical protein
MTRTYELVKRARGRNTLTLPWWLEERASPAVAVRLSSVFDSTSNYHERRLRDAAAACWLYERDKWAFSSFPTFLSNPEYAERWGDKWWVQGATSNLVKTHVDSATAWLMNPDDQVRLEVRANNAPFELRRVIQDRSLALDATTDTPRARDVFQDIGRDGMLTGWGAGRAVPAEGGIRYRRLQAHQCWWDPVDAMDGDPWAFVVAETWDRWQLEAWYEGLDPQNAGLTKSKHQQKLHALAKIPSCSGDWLYGRAAYETPYQWSMKSSGTTVHSDLVLVVHAWRRSTTPDRERADGRYVMIVAGERAKGPLLLCDQPYLWPRLPVFWWSPYPSPSGGITGTGMAHVLRGHQSALDESDRENQAALNELGYLKMFVDPATLASNEKVIEQYADFRVRPIFAPGLQTPVIHAQTAQHPAHLAWSKDLRERAREDSGLPAVIVSGQTQRGAGAPAVAMIEETDTATDRVSDVFGRWNLMRLGAGERTMEVIEDSLAASRDFRVEFQDKDGSWRSASWSQLHRLNEEYQIALEPSGASTRSRYGRILKTLELASQGQLDPALAQDAVTTSPDTRALLGLDNAALNLILDYLAVLCDPKGKHDEVYVDADLDLPLAIDLTTRMINDAKHHRATLDTIDRLRSFKASCQAVLDELQAQARPTAPEALPAEGAAPGVAGLLGPGPAGA